MTARSDIRVDAVFDIETQNWTEFVCGGVLHTDGSYQAYDWRREDDFFDHLLCVRGKAVGGGEAVGNLWSHNGGAFDIKWALDHAARRQISCTAVSAGSRVICASISNVRFLDSKALTKISLEDLTKGASIEKEKLGFTCIGRKKGCTEEEGECKGYCAISRRMDRKSFRRLLEYLESDCRSLFGALQRIREYAATSDLDLGISVGSSAWKSAKRLLELPRASLSVTDHMFARRSYFGGRVQIFRPEAKSGHEYDVNSMYPSRLAHCAVPIGKPVRLYGSDGSDCRRTFGGKAGIYRARVDVPPMHLPPLPLRFGSRVGYPTGVFCGVWTGPELEFAESIGVKILDITEALVWPNSSIIFKPWVDKLFDLRAKALGWDGKPNKKGPLGTFLKFYANSLTGKFGARPDTEKVVIAPSLVEIEAHACTCPAQVTQRGECRCNAWRQLDDAGNIYAEPKFFIQPCAHIEWCSYLTSLARVEWLEQARSTGNEGIDVCYGDTDSLFTLKKRTRNIGKALGQWDEGEKWENFRAFAPKVYRKDTALGPTVRAKGIRLPRDPVKADHILASGAAYGKSAVIGFRAGARLGEFFKSGKLERKLKIGYGDRILDGETTRAPTFQECVERFE